MRNKDILAYKKGILFMKKKWLSIIAILLLTVMLVGAFGACDDQSETETTDALTLEETETSLNDTETESETVTEDESDTDTEDDSETGTGTTVEVIPNEYDRIIDNAYSLSNGVQGYFTDAQRTYLVLENQQIDLTYARGNSKDQLITSLTDKDGNPYIENTMDAFVTMKNGNTFYASQSNVNTVVNFFRLGYYYYEARVEGQNFQYKVFPTDEKAIEISFSRNSLNDVTKAELDDNGVLSFEVKRAGTDPYVILNNIDYLAEDYNYVQFAMKVELDNIASGQIYYKANGNTGFSEAQSSSFAIKGDGEYHTYTVKLEKDNFKGQVTSLRIDVAGAEGTKYEIKDFKLVKGTDGGVPENLSIVRSFLVYSDKMHSFIQFASKDEATTDIARLGYETKIPKDTVSKVIAMDANGLHDSFDGVDWSSVEYVGFDITEAGIFGFILPIDGSGGTIEVSEDSEGNYVIIQYNTPENNTIEPSAEGTDNANDYYIGQRIYTDDSHSFDDFIYEAYNERNPLKNIIVSGSTSTGGSYLGYDALRGIYKLGIEYDSFNPAYYKWHNRQYNVNFAVRGDGRSRNIYLMTYTKGMCLECAALLDSSNLMLPIPIQVGKNFSEANGERNLYNQDDVTYSEAIIPLVLNNNEKYEFNFINLYQNWGRFPLKQISWIQFYAPVYHLSTGVIETNCIVPWGGMRNTGSTLNTLPDHIAMSAPLWTDQPQHSSGGTHHWLLYSDAEGNYSSSENISNVIDSFGPTYADIEMEYISHDGRISVTYTHTEMPQTDENRAYYEMKYTVLEDITFKDFAHSFSFYTVTDNDPTGIYQNVGYLNADNECCVVDANLVANTHIDYPLGDECPYFSFFNMANYSSTSQQGYVNLSFLIYNSEFIIGGEKAEPQFLLVNYNNYLTLTLNLDEVTFKAGDTFTINAIVMPWGSQESVYDSEELAPDWNVRAVRENSLLNHISATPGENTERIESVFVPKLKSKDGKTAEFTLTGGCKNESATLGQHNIAVRVYGFSMLTAPVVEEYVDGEWVVYEVSSAKTPDMYGYAYAYDGYCIYKDPDGTYSYSFVVDMTEGVDRSFRISADKEFKKWPVIEIQNTDANDPLEKYYTANEILTLSASAASSCESIALSEDSEYVRFTGLKDRALEACFTLFSENEKETGNYIVIKYRIPKNNQKDIQYLEFWAATEYDKPETARKSFRVKTSALYMDGNWHVAVIDLSEWNTDVFKASEDGKYYSKYLRFDVFNTAIGAHTSIDIANISMSASLEAILEQFSDMETVSVYTTDTNKTIISTATGEIVENEVGTPGTDETDTETEPVPVEKVGVTYELKAEDIYNKAKGASVMGKLELLNNGEYTRFYSSTEYRESYFTAYKKSTSVSSGQYFIIKYRTNDPKANMEVFTSTTNLGATAGDNKYLTPKSGVMIGDGEWHTVVLDLSGWKSVTGFNGQYDLTYIRFDLFDYDYPAADESAWIDLAFMVLCDDYDTALAYDSDADSILFYDGVDLSVIGKTE